MRVAVVTWAWPSHFYPMVPLAWALCAAGHEVRLVSQPALEREINRSGLQAVICGDDVDVAGALRTVLTPDLGYRWQRMSAGERDEVTRRMHGPLVAVAESMADDLIWFAEAWRPNLVVYDTLAYAGPLVARRMDLPAVRHLFGGPEEPPSPIQREMLASLLDRTGVAELEMLADVCVDPCPPSIQLPGDVRRQFMRLIPFNPSGTLPDWARIPSGRPRILLSWGVSAIRTNGDEAYELPTVIDALYDLDAELVITAASAAERRLLPGLPPGTRVVEHVPFDLLVPTCDMVIHTGGAGTTGTAAVHGLPQVVLPVIYTQLIGAKRLAATGAGEFLLRRGADDAAFRRQIREVVEKLLGDGSYREAAMRLSREIAAQPTPAEVVGVLERIVEDGEFFPVESRMAAGTAAVS